MVLHLTIRGITSGKIMFLSYYVHNNCTTQQQAFLELYEPSHQLYTTSQALTRDSKPAWDPCCISHPSLSPPVSCLPIKDKTCPKIYVFKKTNSFFNFSQLVALVIITENMSYNIISYCLILVNKVVTLITEHYY